MKHEHNEPIKVYTEDGKERLNFPQKLLDDIVSTAYQYLQPVGWFNGCPSDSEGYTPWYTFPAIEFLKDIIDKDHKVLEYGSGYSSLFYKDKVKELLSVEHDKEWAVKITNEHPGLEIHVVEQGESAIDISEKPFYAFRETQSKLAPRSNHVEHDIKHGLANEEFAAYASMIYAKPKGYYDIVVVDGMARGLCAWYAADMISKNGFIILDNSDRCQYNYIQQFLQNKGFGRVDFWGLGYGQYQQFCTSFYSKQFKFKSNKLNRPIKPGPITT
jgi:hypothetical protein